MEPAAEQHQPPAEPGSEAPQRRRDDALANSVPDDNHLLMQMIKLVLHREGSPGRPARPGLLAAALSGCIMLVWVVAKWGVPAILAAQTLIMQLHSDALKEHLADRDVAQQQLQATRDLGAGVSALNSKIDTQAAKLTQLGADVDSIKQRQAASDARLGRLSAQQAAQAKRMEDSRHVAH